MLGRDEVITAAGALASLMSSLPEKSPSVVTIPIEDALERISAEEILSPEDLPPFARSTVDGYAVKARDTFGATETMPAYLSSGREIVMGRESDFALGEGEASKVPTGGMLPAGADAVVMFEHLQRADDKIIEIMKPVTPGENVVRAGEDVRKGDILIREGHLLRPQEIGALAGLGITEVRVYRRPRVAIISTGDEIVPARAVPGPGRIRDVNSYILAGMVSEAGCIAVKKGIFRDDYAEIRGALEEALKESDAVALSGGTSVGTKDVVARIINDIGRPGVVFHGVSLKPGKPMIGGVVEGVPIFGLPGHPAAVSVCFGIFMKPVLDRLSGRRERYGEFEAKKVSAKISKNVSSTPGREEHVRVALEERDDGIWAIPVLGKSGLITTLVKADGVTVIPLGRNGIERGEVVEVKLF